jgi:hypothetical protein
MSENEKSILLVPLFNFDSNIKSLKLDDKINLKQISKNEIKQLRKVSGIQKNFWSYLHGVNYVLELDPVFYSRGKKFLMIHFKHPGVYKTLLSLRLLKPGEVSVSCSFWLKEDINQEGRDLGIALPFSLKKAKKSYFLEKKDIKTLRELLKCLQNIEKHKPYLSYLLSQFNKSYGIETPEDKIVEFITIFESIVYYHKKNLFNITGKTLGTTIGLMLGKNQNESEKIKQHFIDAYSIKNAKGYRNRDQRKEICEKININELSNYLEDCLRYILRKRLGA